MQRLTEFEQHEIRNIDQIVFRIDSGGTQAILHPFGRRAYFTPRNAHTGITGSSLAVFDFDFELRRMTVDRKLRNIRPFHPHIFATTTEISSQISGHADMRCSIDTIGRQSDSNQIIVFNMKIFLSRHSHRCIGRKLHDSIVRSTDTKFIFSAEHSERFHTADLTAFDLELLVAAFGIEYGAHRRTKHFQTGSAIRCTADDLQRFADTDIHGRNMQMIGIGMIDAGLHFGNNDPFEVRPL